MVCPGKEKGTERTVSMRLVRRNKEEKIKKNKIGVGLEEPIKLQ